MPLTAIAVLKTIAIYDNPMKEQEALIILEGYTKSFTVPSDVLKLLTINNFAGKICRVVYNNLLQLKVEDITIL